MREGAEGKPAELIGVDPSKVDVYLKDMLNKCKLIQPDYMPITEVVHHNGKIFILVWAPGGNVRPYSAPKIVNGKNSERIYWIRKMASTVKPSESEKRDLYTLANNVPFDDRINHESDLSDLNITLIKSYLKEVESSLYQLVDTMDFKELCRNMNIVDGPDEYIKPKNVGLMFFSMNPEKFFPYAHIDIVEFPEGEGGDILREQSFTGPLHQQLRDALLYLKNVIIKEEVVKSSDKAEADRFFNYPYAAIEESLSNAVYHKGYDSREPIEVRVLPDRIEILSHPGADRSISIEGLRAYRALSRRYRNRRVGEFLKEMRLTEGRNTGLHKIVRASRENGSPDPLFETDEDRLYFLVTLYCRKGKDSAGEKGQQFESKRASVQEEEYPPKLEMRKIAAERRELLLSYFKENPSATIHDAEERFLVARATVDRDIRELKKQGRLRRKGSSFNGFWEVL